MNAAGVLDLVLSRLEHAKSSGGRWTASCPAHEDRSPSLSVSAGQKGVLIKCFAGCTTEEIVSALGLRVGDLFYERGTRVLPPLPPPPAKPKRAAPKGRQALGKLVRTYDYTNADGVLVYQVCRFEPKDFRQRQPNSTGGWIWNLRGVELVLYHLPLLIEAIAAEQTVYLVEGEKDAETMMDYGLVATTCAGGADKWHDSYTATLAGAHVVMLPDNDKVGRQYAAHIAGSLLSIAATIRVMQLPKLAKKGDVSDWFAHGGTAPQLIALANTHRPISPAPKWRLAESWKRA